MDADRKRRLRKAVLLPLGIVLGGLAFVVLLHPPCPILALTGLYCPGCGGQRMILTALHGDLGAAFRFNPFLFAALPLLALYGLAEAVRYARGKPPLARRKGVRIALGAAVLAAIGFMVLRNLPGLEFLHP